MALSGWPLGLLFRVSAPEVLPGQKVVNDAAYLVEQSGPLLWVFARDRPRRLRDEPRPPRRGARGRRSSSPPRPPGSTRRRRPPRRPTACRLPWSGPCAPSSACPAPATSSCSGRGPATLPRPSSSPAGACPTSASRPYLTQFASRTDLEARHEVVYRFFRTTSREEALGDRALARRLASSPSTAATACASTRPASSSPSTRRGGAGTASSTGSLRRRQR